MFATLVVELTASDGGGDLVISHAGKTVTLKSEKHSGQHIVAFFADCTHEVTPVLSGCRVVLVYNLSHT